ncbi:hypothetical protein SAMN05660297_02066 [Natronincola peptidivorans]|uniref:NAD(P)-dependent dehydrogenase, short-chain alcohol dehydrogenase family n=1 Tax=Natronincola peptidivorans TaxID=426128 RepID=A0A1I0DM26_9FIRM|nr:glucose 1-dehydrogenase [Natronincola peptidivorans]SET33543.1 hypothetical protein SAMN05660297_02066 [Natronincola peptidivorans]
MRFEKKVVLVTGAANGIGKIIAAAYGKAGARVVMADIDEENGRNLEKQYQGLKYDARFYRINLANTIEITEMMDYIINHYGRLDILINNAGISKFKSLYDLTIDEWDEIINVNLRSHFVTAKEFAKHMKDIGGGKIINIASTRHLMSEPNAEAYAASKGGIVSLTHALAVSLSKDNIKVNAISPGWIETGDYKGLREVDHAQHPAQRVGKPEDIARACLFLTDDENDFINGENLVVDGGMTKKMIYEE